MREGLWGLTAEWTDLVMAAIGIVAVALASAWILWSLAAL